jgi:hypothetical protein
VVALCVFVAGALPASSQQRHAFVVGIDTYHRRADPVKMLPGVDRPVLMRRFDVAYFADVALTRTLPRSP